MQFVVVSSLDFYKKSFNCSRVCRTILIRNALEDPDPGASDGASDLLIRLFGADLVTFEVGGVPPESGNSLVKISTVM